MDRVIAMDVGGTLVKYGVVCRDGARSWMPAALGASAEGGEMLMERLLDAIGRLARIHGRAAAVAVSSPGLISADHGVIEFAGGNAG